jgi:hypothetical protein
MNSFHFHSVSLNYSKLKQRIVQNDGIGCKNSYVKAMCFDGFRMALWISSLHWSINAITMSDLFQTMNTDKTVPITFETDQFKSQIFRMIHYHSDLKPKREWWKRIDPAIGISLDQLRLICAIQVLAHHSFLISDTFFWCSVSHRNFASRHGSGMAAKWKNLQRVRITLINIPSDNISLIRPIRSW